MTFQRSNGRAHDALRPVTITRSFTRHAEGSVLIAFGDTKVLCTASVEEKVPPHKRAAARAGSRPNTACCRAPRTPAATVRRRAASRAGGRRRSSG